VSARIRQGGPGECFATGIGPAGDTITDPDALLAQLAADGTAKLVSRAGTGAAEVETWSYSYTVAPATPGTAGRTYSGTATVDASTQHVTELTESSVIDGVGRNAVSATYEFSGFGTTKVSVTAPSLAPAAGPSPATAPAGPSPAATSSR
jgi:hypothetical protein